jgi:hypothetical protein
MPKRKRAKRATRRRRPSKQNLKVFVSWSGKEAEKLGTRLRERLPGIVPNIQIFFSPTIAPGAVWTKAVEKAIQEADYAILCVTKGNLDSRWMNFEAGALWRARKQSYVCPLLLNLEPGGLQSPYSLFQARRFNDKEFKDLCKHLASRTKMDMDQFQRNFEVNWPPLSAGFFPVKKKNKRKP